MVETVSVEHKRINAQMHTSLQVILQTDDHSVVIRWHKVLSKSYAQHTLSKCCEQGSIQSKALKLRSRSWSSNFVQSVGPRLRHMKH